MTSGQDARAVGPRQLSRAEARTVRLVPSVRPAHIARVRHDPLPAGLSLAALRDAHAHIADHVHRTPVQSSAYLGREIGAPVTLKCENLQKTGSFKPRGALNRLRRLDDAVRRRGVVTVSAGNHAQALAWAARTLGAPCTVVMPAAASPAKAAASRGYGADVVLHGTVFEAFDKAHELEAERGLSFVHPFDDEHIVAGQASVGLEIVEQVPEVTVIVVPIGGGGLVSGIAAAVKQQRPSVKVYGVEPEGACAMRRSLDAGEPVRLDRVQTVADGLAPPMAGVLTYRVVRGYVDDVVTVRDEEILAAMRPIFARAKLVVEPSGAAAVAALLTGRVPVSASDRVVAVLSGGNVAVDRLGELWGEGSGERGEDRPPPPER